MPSPVSALTKIKNMFSPLERTIIAHKMESMPSSQWAAYIKANAPKAAKKEALAIKLDELLARQPKLSKADIVKHIQENSPKINTKNLRADGYGIDETQYGKYVLPGGEDYTETLIHLPANTSSPSIRMQKVFEIADENGQLLASGTVPMSPRTLEKLNNNPNWVVREYEQPHPADILRDPSNFRSGHFDEPNVLAHLRTNIKLTPDNKDVLFLEELQSDWAQQGRKKGFLRPDLHVERRAEIKAQLDELAKEGKAMSERGENASDIHMRMMQLNDALNDIAPPKGIPRGPYVEDTGDWTALGLKKAIERAVDEGQSHLAWTTGTQQADRYNLAKQIDELMVTKNPDNTVSMIATLPGGGERSIGRNIPMSSVSDYIGSDLAKQIETQGVGGEVYNADALRVGGEGMKTYYDQIVPSTANDILKSMGVTERVKPIGVQLGNNVSEQMGFEITPEIRDYVMNQGLPAFAGGGVVKAAAKGLREMAEQYMAPKAAPAVSRIDMNFKDVTKRVPELTRAANMLETGEISASEYDKLVNSLKPVTPYSFVPAPATYEDAMRALTKNKQPMYGKASEIPAGEQTDLRLDIPAYKDHGVWVNSIHRKNAPTVYDSVSSVKNATMIGAPDKALKVAKGGPKAPFAVIRGEWNPISQEDAVKKAQENLASGEWVQVGYDPERHGYFYDRNTMEPVSGAEEILQIGPLVIAKNPAYAAKAEQKFAGGGVVKAAAKGLRGLADRYQLAMKVAQRNAALPVSEGGLGLPPDNTAIDRAIAMGFKGVEYHTTDAKNADDIYEGGFSNVSRGQRNFSALGKKYGKDRYYNTGVGNYTSDNPFASEFTSQGDVLADKVMFPLMVNKSKHFDYTNPEHVKDLMTPRKAEDYAGDFGTKEMNPSDLKALQEGQHHVMEDWLTTQNLKKRGYTGTNLKEPQKFYGGEGTTTNTFDTRLFRSKFAAFDPMRRNENDILAGVGVGLPVSGVLAEQPLEKAEGGPVHMDEGGLNVRASGDYGNFDSASSSGSHYNFSTDVDILNKYGFGVTKEGQVFKLPARTYTFDDGYTVTQPGQKIKRDDISELRARYTTDEGVQYGVGRQPLAKGWSAYRTDPRSQSSVGVNVSPYYKGINYTKNFAEGGKVSDPFASLSMMDKAKLLAKAAKYRIQYNKQAVEHGKYPDALSSELKKNYLDTVGNSRVNRSPLDVALNYGGGYDFGVRQDIPADVARDMGKAYQYTDYFFSPFTGPKSDAVGDYYENMAGVEAGIKERGRRATEAEIQRRSAEYGRGVSKMLPQYEEPNYAEGGAVETDDVDYDSMYEFKKDEPAFAEGGEVDYDAMYEFKDNTVGFAKGGPVLSVGRGEKLPVAKGAGLTAKGRAKYNAATGSNLKAPAPHPKTDADAGRRKSFCARMSGMPGPMKDEQGNPTRKAASLKRWNC